MEKSGVALAIALLAIALPANAADDPLCKLCLDAQDQQDRVPLDVEVDSGIVFNRLALAGHGQGQATIDPQTGQNQTQGNLVDLGGLSFQGHAKVTGEPYASVFVQMPSSVTLYSASGAKVELRDFSTNLLSLPVLDANGTLEFTFGARLESNEDQGGSFRGRIPIHVEYG